MRHLEAARMCGVIVLAGALVTPSRGTCQERGGLTLERAVALALEHNLGLRAAALELELAQSDIVDARIVATSNPELSGGAGVRIGADGLSPEAGAALSQAFALGRPRRHRIDAAEARRDAAEHDLERTRRRVARQARVAYVRAVAAAQLLELARQAADLGLELQSIATERRDADAGTDLEVNLAALERARSRREHSRATRDLSEARLELLRVLGQSPSTPPPLPDHLPPLTPIEGDLDELVALALDRRLELSALDRLQQGAEAELALARAEAAPDLEVEASWDLEEGNDHIIGVGLSLPLPLFRRNQGEIAAARTRQRMIEAQIDTARRDIEQEVRLASSRYRAAREIAEVLGSDVIGRAGENLELLRASFEEGNVGIVEVLLMQRELLAARREHIEALVELHRAAAELDLALGQEVP